MQEVVGDGGGLGILNDCQRVGEKCNFHSARFFLRNLLIFGCGGRGVRAAQAGVFLTNEKGKRRRRKTYIKAILQNNIIVTQSRCN